MKITNLFSTLTALLLLGMIPHVYGEHNHSHFTNVVVIVCKCENNTNIDCNKKVPDTTEFIYTVITKNPKKRFDNLSKHKNVYKNKDGETFTFTGEYIVLKDNFEYLDIFHIPFDEPHVVGTAL
jgi:hypothetical protein